MFKQGETRLVILIGKYAIKIPNFLKGYKQFLYGILSNCQEADWSGKNKYLLPVLFCTWGGFIVVMPRVKCLNKLTDKTFYKITTSLGVYPKVDKKTESFGVWNNKIYVIDYGTTV